MTRYIAPQGHIHSFERGGQVYQVHADGHNGSVRAITDSSGAVVAHYEFDARGNQLGSSSPFSGSFSYNFCGSLGLRTDEQTGLIYARNRWYSAGLGRFLSRDPIGGINRYAYCNNDPVNWVDPMGLKPTIVLYMPHASPHGLDTSSLRFTAEQYGFDLQTTNVFQPNLGYNTQSDTLTLQVNFMRGMAFDHGNTGELTKDLLGWTYDGARTGEIDIYTDNILYQTEKSKGDCPDLTTEQALKNRLSYALKHEIFVHAIGLTVPSRQAIFRADFYDRRGYLESGNPRDINYNIPWRLSPEHPYTQFRVNQGLPVP